jgi:hypothetical protein
MTDQGKYTQLWKKYLPVISILLKKTDAGVQRLQFYKHEFDKTGARSKTGYHFAVRVNEGKLIRKEVMRAPAMDLLMVLNENDMTSQVLKNKQLLITLTKDYELIIENA